MKVGHHRHHSRRHHQPTTHEEATPNQANDSAASMTYKRTERVGLFIQTTEGDAVRLRFGTRERLTIDQAQGEEGTAGEVAMTSRTNSKISISIKGDLNADEMAAIQQTFEQATALADEFFAGNLQAAFEGAAALNFDGEQLARVSLKASLKQQLTYSSSGFTPAAPPAEAPPRIGGPAGEAPSEVGSPDEMHIHDPDSTAGTVEGSSPSAETAELEEQAPPAEVGEPTEEATPETSATFDPAQIIGTFLSRLAESLSGASESEGNGLLDFSLKVRVFKSTLLTLSEIRAPEEPQMPELVPETLDALAELQQAPVDEVA